MSKEKIYIHYKRTSEGGGITPGQENEKWPNFEPVWHHYNFLYASLEPNNERNWEEIKVNKSLLFAPYAYVPVVFYTSGDTFSTTHGNADILGAFVTKKKAQSYLDKKVNEKGYNAWEGYFNRPESTEVIKVPVLGAIKK